VAPSFPLEQKDRPRRSRSWSHVIGIVGGMGPYAHLELERQLLLATSRRLAGPPRDQDYPAWRLSSFPSTPDRTGALLGIGRSPVPSLERAVRSLITGPRGVRADFVLVACITAHAFVDELQRRVSVPILDLVEETVARATHDPRVARIGVLATTGTLEAKIFERAAPRSRPNVEIISLRDVTAGERPGDWLQEHLVMESIYGPRQGRTRGGGGLKSGGVVGAVAQEAAARFAEGAHLLVSAGADVVILGCTEIPVVLTAPEIDGIPLLDPLAVCAEAAIDIAAGTRALPERMGVAV
jgi:aspartate racemase